MIGADVPIPACSKSPSSVYPANWYLETDRLLRGRRHQWRVHPLGLLTSISHLREVKVELKAGVGGALVRQERLMETNTSDRRQPHMHSRGVDAMS